jgi:hypothetical protein
MLIERKYIIRYGGAIKKGNFYQEAIKPLLICKEYTFRDKINYLKGNEVFENPFMGCYNENKSL